MSEQAGEKTEPASEKRREEYRERGEIARSRDIVSVLILFCGLAYFFFLGPWLYEGLGRFIVQFCALRPQLEMTPGSMLRLGREAVIQMALIIGPLAAMVIAASVLGTLAQIGVLFTAKPLTPDLNRINIFGPKLITTFFNKQALGNLVGSLAKITVVGLVVWLTLAGEGPKLRAISTLPLYEGIHYLVSEALLVVFNVALILILIAAADYAWQRYVMEEKMKMTKQEVKDEHKEVEGNPLQKGAQRKRAMDIAQQRMMTAVPKADVIVNNPTHIAIALRYIRGKDTAPIVVAKGKDLVALQIRRIATAHGVPMVENVPLARGLYRHVKVGRPVPSDFYRAVAEVLAYVYRLRQKRRQPSPPRPPIRDTVTRSPDLGR